MNFLLRTATHAACALCLGGAVSAQVIGEKIDELDGVEVEQHLEAQLPVETPFVNQDGDSVAFGDMFDGERPVILTLNYVDCPQMCSLQLSELAKNMARVDLDLGDDYRVVTVSIDPRDTPERVRAMRDRYVGEYRSYAKDEGREVGEAEAQSGWTILCGDEDAIARVAETAGFGFKWLPDREEYAHKATNILVSPDGVITQYMNGFVGDLDSSQTLRLALVDASDGKIGTLFDEFFLNCLIYDPNAGSYSLAAWRLLRVAAVLTVVAIITGVFFMKRTGEQQAKPAAGANGETRTQ